MFTSDIKSTSDTRVKHGWYAPIKTAMVYLVVSFLCMVITNVYALFGHGVRSDSMDFMFLYPLIGGAVVFLLIALLLPFMSRKLSSLSRIGYNLYNSGIAALTSAAMLTGIMEIAGTGSVWIIYLRVVGFVLLIAAIAWQAVAIIGQNSQ